jgi:hypothetical protein
MFEDLPAMADRYAELHADRARLQAELEQALVASPASAVNPDTNEQILCRQPFVGRSRSH